jgi:hypothetical protein
MPMLHPPKEWEDRPDAGEYRDAVARLAHAEADVLRAEEHLRVNAPKSDHWEALYDWSDAAVELMTALQTARESRDEMERRHNLLLIRWHDEDRGKA